MSFTRLSLPVAAQVPTAVNQHGHRDVLQIEPVEDKWNLELGVNESSRKGVLIWVLGRN